eukprot:UN20433
MEAENAIVLNMTLIQQEEIHQENVIRQPSHAKF